VLHPGLYWRNGRTLFRRRPAGARRVLWFVSAILLALAATWYLRLR